MKPDLNPAAAPGPRRILVIAPAAFLNSLTLGYINLGMLLIVKEVFSAPPAAIGWFGSIYFVSYFAACILFRGVTSRLAPRISMLFALSVFSVSLLVFLIRPSLTSAFIVYGILGTATAFYWPPLMGWLSRGMEGPELSRIAGIYNLAWSTGAILSPYLAGAMSQANKFLPVFTALGNSLLTGAFILLSRRLMRDPEERPVPLPDAPKPEDRSTPLRFSAWVGVFALYSAIGGLTTIFPLFARNEIGMSESQTGFMMTIRAAASMAGFVLFGRTAFWRFRKKLLILPPLLACLFSLQLLVSGSSSIFLTIGLIGIGFTAAWAYNNSMFYGASGAPDRDRRMTIHEALLTAGQVMGSLVGGFLYQAVSMGLVFLFMALLSLSSAGLQALFFRRRIGESRLQRPPLVR